MNFKNKPLIGMIHLAGENPVERALEEIDLFNQERLAGVIIENYHNGEECVVKILEETAKQDYNLEIGINILPNEFDLAFFLAANFEASFIQIDNIAGNYDYEELDVDVYNSFREKYKDIKVLGGVWPKYYEPVEGSNFEKNLKEGMKRCDAIVITGERTGEETPLKKIRAAKKVTQDFPIIVGAGVNLRNVYTQLSIADGAIIGSYFKKGNTQNPVDRMCVRELECITQTLRPVWRVYTRNDKGKCLVGKDLNKLAAERLINDFSRKKNNQKYWLEQV